MDNPAADRVKKVAALASAKGRRRTGMFLAEGPQPVREALKLWLARYEPASAESHQDAEGPLSEHPGAPLGELPELDALFFSPEALEAHSDLAALLDQVRAVLFDPSVELPRGARIFLREATAEVLGAMCDAETSQGIVAVCRIPKTGPVQEHLRSVFSYPGTLLVSGDDIWNQPMESAREAAADAHAQAQNAPGPRPWLGAVLVGLQDPGNVGTLIRTADAAGAQGVALTPGTVDPWSPKVVRSAAGSHFHLPVITGVTMRDLQAHKLELGFQLLAAHGYATMSIDDLTHAQPDAPVSLAESTVWLFGHEAHGLSEEDLAAADAAVAIPLYGQAESLNVSVAGAVCLYASAMAQRQGAR